MKAAPATTELIEIAGTVQTLFCQRPTFSAGILNLKGREVKFAVKGYVRAGEPVTLKGRWDTHPKYGKQFVATEVVYKTPADPAGLAEWLKWYAAGIGPAKAQKLVDEFGLDLMRLCGEDPGQVAACVGVPIESIHRIAEEWSKFAARIAAASQLAAWGMTQRQTEVILERCGGGAVALIRDDPYAVLGLVDGFGWSTTDELAGKLGITGTDPRRVRAAVAYVVREKYGEGSTAVPYKLACELVTEKLGLESSQVAADCVRDAVELGRVRQVGGTAEDGAGGFLATPAGYAHESAVWKVLLTGRDANPHTGADGSVVDFKMMLLAERYAKLTVKGCEVELDKGQVRAVYTAARYRVSVITGGAGAGKTLVARVIHKLFTDDDVPVMLCAPTGKAARRLTEVIGAEASTIHRLLEFNGGTGHFGRTADNPLFEDEWVTVQNEWGDGTHKECRKKDNPGGVVICDEASMIDAQLAYHLLSAIGPHTSLVLIGDPNQLPPVGPGALLRDVLAHDLAPVARLDQCHRQAGTLKQNCVAVLAGRVEPTVNTEEPSPWIVGRNANDPAKVLKVIEKLYAEFLPKWGFDPIRDTQVMTAKHEGAVGTRRVNILLQRLHQRTLGVELPEPGEDDHHLKPTLYVGDKVIQTVNDYTLDVMNGTIGCVVAVEPKLVVEYDGREVGYTGDRRGAVALAYCLTPHKMQGSEIPCAVVIVPKAHSFMQHRHWFYTGVTRAQKTAVIVGDEDGIRRAVERIEIDRRQTLLQVFAGSPEARP